MLWKTLCCFAVAAFGVAVLWRSADPSPAGAAQEATNRQFPDEDRSAEDRESHQLLKALESVRQADNGAAIDRAIEFVARQRTAR